ncbi:MAG: tetratricopeptide repeat protein [Spirochaetales bacterium]|nr:tetratricopeptide repeat protein [Spirochaetales bacterium]
MPGSSHGRAVHVCLVAIVLACSPPRLPAQDSQVDLNTYYKFPVSIGLQYHSLAPITSFNYDYNVFEIAGELRFPLSALPVLQPFVRGGLMQFDSLDPAFPDKWDHRHWYGVLGLAYVHRFVRNFEVGAALLAGVSEAVFPQVIDTGPVGSPFAVIGAGGKIGLVPSYSLSVEIEPSVKYVHALSPLKELNGFIFGVGFAVHYRFGEDPDSARALIRSLRIDRVSLPPLFSAMQSYYVRNPVGSVTITNTERHPVRDLEVSFYQKEFMDSATAAAVIPELAGGESVEIPLYASFNQNVFTTQGVTPLTGEIIATYKSRERAAEQRQPVTYDLYDKTAIVWDDDRKVGAFITPADSALRNYVSFVRQSLKEQTAPRFTEPLQLAMQLYNALRELGLIYQVDPSSPFTQAQGNTMLVDSVSLPRDTLSRITGDCDDLTVLFCSLLETTGVETGYITVPGHIYPVVNTKEAGRSYRSIHPNRSLTLNIDGELWVPVEITMVGTNGFLDAWGRGAELWNSYEEQPELRGFYRTRQAQGVYRPVGLRETDLGLQYGEPRSIAAGFSRDLSRVADAIAESYRSEAEASRSPRAYSALGMAYARFARYQEAETAFNRALQLDSSYASAMVNLGNVRYLRQDYRGALRLYENARDALEQQKRGDSPAVQLVLLNISQAHHALENYDQAQEYYAQAEQIDPGRVREYAFLGTAGGSARASDAGSRSEVLFLDEE